MKVAESYLAENQKVDIEPLQSEAQNAETMKEYIRQADQIEGYNAEILGLKDKSDTHTEKLRWQGNYLDNSCKRQKCLYLALQSKMANCLLMAYHWITIPRADAWKLHLKVA